MSRIDKRALTSLAILRVNWEHDKDYLDIFIPFVFQTVRLIHEDVVTPSSVRSKLTELIGFKIPSAVVSSLLRRCTYRGYFRHSSSKFTVLWDKLPEDSFSKAERDIDRKLTAVVDSLISFASDEFAVEWTRDESEAALLNFLEASAPDLLISLRKGNADLNDEDVESDDKLDYLVAKFINDSHSRKPEIFDYLESVTVGAMLANVVYYESPDAVYERFEDLEIYIDTPVVLDLLGANGEDRKALTREIVDLSKRLNVPPKLFQTTFDEIQSVLNAYASLGSQWRRQARWDVRRSLKPSEAKLLASSMRSKLEEQNIEIVPKPDYDRRYSMNERGLEDALQEEINYSNNAARVHDTEALVSIFQLRKGRRPSRLEEAKAVFVSTNAGLIRAASKFYRNEYGNSGWKSPLCIRSEDYATRLWLKLPNAAPDLPKRRLFTRVHAALQPSDKLGRVDIQSSKTSVEAQNTNER